MTVTPDGHLAPGPQKIESGLPARQAEELNARILDALRDYAIFALDDDGRIASWSEAAGRLTGYEREEVLGEPFSTVGSRQLSELEAVLAVARHVGAAQQERWWRRRDGGLILVDELINPLDGTGYVVIARDLTERSLAEERQQAQHAQQLREAEGLGRETALRSELQAAERRASFLAEASSILVATSLEFETTVKALSRLAVSRLSDWCVIHSLNDDGELERSLAAHRDPAAEARLRQALTDELTPEWEQAVHSVISTGQSQIIGRADLIGAAEADLAGGAVMITPLMGRGRVLGAITFVGTGDVEYDDDDLALAEELGRRAAIALDNARLYREAQEANRAKADFLAVISHELRTPLNAIMGYSDLLDARISGELTDKQRRQVDRIRASARHLLQLIEEILSFARIETGGEEVTPDLLEARILIEEVAAVAEPLARSKSLDFLVEAQPGVTLETDLAKARQILVNLMSNAIKFTEHGSVSLRMRTEGENVIFEVVDTGVGIPPAQMDRIFDPFWQAERPNTRRVGGTGLGLSVSRRYIRLLRGELAIESEPGRGTKVSVILPLRLTGSSRRRD
jgi:PAS domain S-box-containing protein